MATSARRRSRTGTKKSRGLRECPGTGSASGRARSEFRFRRQRQQRKVVICASGHQVRAGASGAPRRRDCRRRESSYWAVPGPASRRRWHDGRGAVSTGAEIGTPDAGSIQRAGGAGRAVPLGGALAVLGVHLVTGGGAGVMSAVARGFTGVPSRRGLSVGILPAAEPPGADPGLPAGVPLAPSRQEVIGFVRSRLPSEGQPPEGGIA